MSERYSDLFTAVVAEMVWWHGAGRRPDPRSQRRRDVPVYKLLHLQEQGWYAARELDPGRTANWPADIAIPAAS